MKTKVKKYIVFTFLAILSISLIEFIYIKKTSDNKINDRYDLNNEQLLLYDNNRQMLSMDENIIDRYNQPSDEAYDKLLKKRVSLMKKFAGDSESLTQEERKLLPPAFLDISNETTTLPIENKSYELIKSNSENILKIKITGKIIVPNYGNYCMYEAELLDQYKGKTESNIIYLILPIEIHIKDKIIYSNNLTAPLKLNKEYIVFSKKYRHHGNQTDELKYSYVVTGGFNVYLLDNQMQNKYYKVYENLPYSELQEAQITCFSEEDMNLYNQNKKKILEIYNNF
ncbi:hypothetical protein RBG61_11700 [Paludicola sp. MB14-C6]|uniref:hypothetical protein n=1 Tax=Paludihabitans sp. MB14-C6 TaxID=3070656 RepID=UPI0027DBBA61|nr:hypothetical protein [Paludicola sp. MB14-C6]WMJ22646.1 hypothetical protein RBG61_11700 [Paludicola sp. MB14-C6]